ncbi:MAG: ral stress protein [Hyphomicrobiales bacterium]|nr:ral stress protein [Hyphomicrobiales bacterium]
MRKVEENAKTPAEIEDRVWELSEKIDFCMLTTWDGESQHSRPMSARVNRAERAVHFLVDVEGRKNRHIEKYPRVGLTFSDTAGNKYVALSGNATISNDRAKIKELWSDFDRAWWDDETDPSIRLLTVHPEDAELWDSPNRLVASAKMLTAAVTGAKPSFGDHGEVKL